MGYFLIAITFNVHPGGNGDLASEYILYSKLTFEQYRCQRK